MGLLLKDDIQRGWGRRAPQKGAGLCTYNVLPQRKCFTNQTTFYFAIHVRTSAATVFAGQICRGSPNHLRQVPAQRTLSQSRARCTGTPLAWRAARPAASASRQYLPAFALADVRGQGNLKNQLHSYTSLIKDVNYTVKPSPCWAATPPRPCAPAQVPPAETSCKLSHQPKPTGPVTSPLLSQ